jgi:carbon-monoxide dehydrogenase medium subunit/xanthine dehydrogenase FAD-binding subunit
VCDGFIQSRSRQEYRKQVTPGFLVRALAKAMKTAGANENACAIAEEVAHG